MSEITGKELPEGWEWVPLRNAVHVILGQSPSSTTYNEEGEGLPFFQGKSEFGEIYPTARKWCTEPKKVAEENDILVSVRAPVGPTNLAPSKCAIGRGLAALRPLDGGETKYFLYLIRRYQAGLAALGTGTTFGAISGDTLKNFVIPLAPLEQQKRIVAKIEELFSHIDAGIKALKKARQLLKQYRQSVLKAAFSGKLTTGKEMAQNSLNPSENWQIVTIEEIAEINPYVDKKQISDKLRVSFVPMPAVEAETGKIDVSQARSFAEVKKGFTPFLEGDVLFAKITPCMENGKMAIVPKLINNYGFGSTEFHVLRPKDRINANYLYYFMSSEKFRGNAQHNMTGAVGQKRVPKNYLREQKIPVPPLDEQTEIVKQIEKKFSAANQLLNEIEHLIIKAGKNKQSVLASAFSGKL